MEGRAFILGRNGFYNRLIEILKKNFNYQIYFVLLFKNETEDEMKSIIDNLIHKGDQKELEFFSQNNLIIYINDILLADLAQKEKLLFHLGNTILNNFCSLKSLTSPKLSRNEININFNCTSRNNNNNIHSIRDDNNALQKSLDETEIIEKIKKYYFDNIYYTYSENSLLIKKNFANDENEILEKLKTINMFQKFTKENIGAKVSTKFNCEIL